jgi:hypothetical protein
VPQISRRALLAGVSSAALAAAFNARMPLRAAEAGQIGRICLGLHGLTYYSGFYSLLNAWKQGAGIRVTVGETDYDSDIRPDMPNSAWGRYLDENGELHRPLPERITAMSRIFFAKPDEAAPAGYDREGDEWVLKWDGSAGQIGISNLQNLVRDGNRVTWTWPPLVEALWVTFLEIDPADPPRNVRLCPARHETRLDAGELFNPDWLEIVREGSGIIRFMDWQGTNSNLSTLRLADIPQDDYFAWGGGTGQPLVKGGMPLNVMSRLAKETGSHPWVCIPSVYGTPKLSAVQTIENSNPAKVSAPGHDWADGDVVVPYLTNWPDAERNRYTVLNADRASGTFELAELDATGFEAYETEGATLTAPYDLASIEAELTPFAAHFRDNVDAPLTAYFEFGNELWNWIFNGPHWLAAQARGKFEDDDHHKMAGFLAAHCMNVIRKTYGPDRRERWRGVLATFVVLTDTTTRMIEGVEAYIAEHAPGLTIRDLFDDVAVTGYWGPRFEEERKAETFALMDESERLWKEGAEPTRFAHFNRVINEQCATALEEVFGFWEQQKAVADAYGLRLIQYEGGNHNDPAFAHSLTPDEFNRFMEFYKNCNHTPEDAANYKAMFERFVELGGEFPSKFVEMAPVGRYGAWGGLRHMGDSNPVWDEVVAFNRRTS